MSGGRWGEDENAAGWWLTIAVVVLCVIC